MESVKDIIKQVLNDFFPEPEVEDSYEDGFLGSVVDEEEKELLATAIEDVLRSKGVI